MTAVVSFSGGQDSTTCLYWALHYHDFIHAVSFHYGQRHRAEIDAATSIIALAKRQYPTKRIDHTVVNIPPALLASKSPLTSDNELETYSSPENMKEIIGDRVELTFIPGRNLVFGAMLVPFAARIDANEIILGICEADGANYPDCTRGFLEALDRVTRKALDRMIVVTAPLLLHSKAESVRYSMTLKGCYRALAYSHTAYSGEYPPKTQDHATVLRASGFANAGVPDPLLVRAFEERLIDQRPPDMLDTLSTLDDVVKAIGAED